MGRYVNGDWTWKFAFGDQSSSFGEVLQDVTKGTENCYTSRYVGTEGQGEQVELFVYDWDEMADSIAGYIGKNFKVKDEKEMEQWSKAGAKFKDDYWDKLMMWKFLKDNYDEKAREEYYNYHVEY